MAACHKQLCAGQSTAGHICTRVLDLVPQALDSFFITVDFSSNLESEFLPLQGGPAFRPTVQPNRGLRRGRPAYKPAAGLWRASYTARRSDGAVKEVRLTYESPFKCLPEVRTDQAERRFVYLRYLLMGGHGPFRGLGAPLALLFLYQSQYLDVFFCLLAEVLDSVLLFLWSSIPESRCRK